MKRGNGVRYPGICRRAEGNILFRVEFNWSPGTRPRFEHENTFSHIYVHIFSKREPFHRPTKCSNASKKRANRANIPNWPIKLANQMSF